MTTAPAAVEPAEEPEESPALPWADLAAEHFQLLRLAALPTDRNTGARPLRFVQFGYAERHDKAHSLLRMEIQLPGRRCTRSRTAWTFASTTPRAWCALAMNMACNWSR